LIVLALLACPPLAAAQPPAGEPSVASEATSESESEATQSTEQAPRGIDEIRIIGTPADVARIGGSAQVIDQAELEEMEYDDVDRVLRKVPGVYLREEDGYGLRPNIGIRGASSERSAKVTLMEDGILFAPAPYSAPAAYYFPVTTRMVAVEVFKGPASIQYGPHTVGGAINLVTRAIPDEPIAAADIAYGQRDYLKAHGWAGRRWKGFGVLLEAIRLETDGFKDLDGGGDTGFTKNEVMFKGDYIWPYTGDLGLVSEIKFGYSDELSHETYLGISDDDFDRTPYRRYAASQLGKMDWDRWQYEISQHVGVTPNLSFRFTGYRHDLDRSWRKLNRFELPAPSLHDIFADPTGVNAVFLSVLRGDSDSTVPVETLLIGTNARKFISQGLQGIGTWNRTIGPFQGEIEAGIRLHWDQIERDHTEDPYRMLNRTLVRSEDPVRQIADNTGEALALATYLHNDLEWGPLTVTPGIRFEAIWTDFEDRMPTLVGLPSDSERDTQTVFIPGIGAVYFLTDEWSLLGGVHRGFSPVAPGQSSSADEEESINYEGGVRYWGSLVSGLAIGFYNDYDNLLATCRQGTGCDPEDVDKQFNGGDVDVAGLELLIDSELEIGWGVTAPLSLTYTFTHSEFQDSFSSANQIFGDVRKGDELPYVPEHQANLSFGLQRGPLGATTTLTYVGEMRDVAGKGHIPANERIDDYFVADLVAHWDFSDRGRLYLGVDNVGDNAYIVSRRPFGARPGLPFQVFGGIKYSFGG